LRQIAAAIALALTLTAVLASPLHTAGEAEEGLLRCANNARAERGIPRLKPSKRLDRAAEKHADAMRDRNFFSHHDPDTGSDPWDRARDEGWKSRYVGENISAGQRSGVEACHDLLASPGHRRNILTARFTHVGLGISRGGSWGHYFVQLFAER
jgi:uncharacterized protein YkwD